VTRLYHGPFVNGLSGSVVSNITPVLPPPKMRWGGAIGELTPKNLRATHKVTRNVQFPGKAGVPLVPRFWGAGKALRSRER
jgi:hypothetical protein